MQIVEVLDTLKIGENTAVTVNSKGDGFKNGVGILDDKGLPHVVLSVAMTRVKPEHLPQSLDTITLLVEGDFNSKKVFC